MIKKFSSERHAAEFARRLNEILDEQGFAPKHEGRQTKLAPRFGVTQKAARKWLEGEGLPETWRINAIARTLGVRAAWLAFGEGPKYPGQLVEAGLSPDQTADLTRLILALQSGHLPGERFRGAVRVLLADLDNPQPPAPPVR